jgi:hypothetical protein
MRCSVSSLATTPAAAQQTIDAVLAAWRTVRRGQMLQP